MEHYHLDRVNDALAYTHGLNQSIIRKYKHGILDIDQLDQTPGKHSTLFDSINPDDFDIRVDLGASNSHGKIKQSIIDSKVKQAVQSLVKPDQDEPSEPDF